MYINDVTSVLAFSSILFYQNQIVFDSVRKGDIIRYFENV